MTKELPTESKQAKFFTINDIVIGTFLTGPFTGVLCLENNYKALGDTKTAKKIRSYGFSIITAILALVMFLPEVVMAKVPNALFPFLFTGGMWLYFKNSQLPKISEKFPEKDFPKKSVGNTLVKMIIGLLIAVGVFFLLGFIQGFFGAFLANVQGA